MKWRRWESNPRHLPFKGVPGHRISGYDQVNGCGVGREPVPSGAPLDAGVDKVWTDLAARGAADTGKEPLGLTSVRGLRDGG